MTDLVSEMNQCNTVEDCFEVAMVDTYMVRRLFGKLFGDKGYLSSSLCAQLAEMGITLITSVKKNMKNRLMPLWDKIMLRKRFLIETVNDQFKNQMQIEHTRHRSPTNFLVNLMSGLLAYSFKPKKPWLLALTNFSKLLYEFYSPLRSNIMSEYHIIYVDIHPTVSTIHDFAFWECRLYTATALHNSLFIYMKSCRCPRF